MKKFIVLTCFIFSCSFANGQVFEFTEIFKEKAAVDFCTCFNKNEKDDFKQRVMSSTEEFMNLLITNYEPEMDRLFEGKEMNNLTGRQFGEEIMLAMNEDLILNCDSYADYLSIEREKSYEPIFEQYRTDEFRQSFRNIVNSDASEMSEDYLFSAGIIAFANDDFTQAKKFLDKVVNKDSDIGTIDLAAYAYEKMGAYDRAIQLYENLPKTNNNSIKKALITRSKKNPKPLRKQKNLSTNAYFGLWESFETNLIHKTKSNQPFEPFEVEKDGIKLVTYESNGIKLKGLIDTQNIEKGKKKPAIVYLHGGFALGYSDVTDCQAFIDAGYIVFAPSYRGENGNDGNLELFLGEVDDAKAAIKWLQSQPYIDAENVSVFGHSAGGGLALNLSLHPDISIKKCGGVAGVYDSATFTDWDYETVKVPFDLENEDETYIRLPVAYLEQMEREHFLYIGKEDGFEAYQDFIKETYDNKLPEKLKMTEVEGDHFSSLEPAMKLFLKELKK